MIKLLSEKVENGFLIREYSRDGVSVSHTIKTQEPTEPIEPTEQAPTLEDKINYIYYKNMGVI